MDLLGEDAVRLGHLRDLREHVAFRLLLGRGGLQLAGAFPHRGALLGRESLLRRFLRRHRSAPPCAHVCEIVPVAPGLPVCPRIAATMVPQSAWSTPRSEERRGGKACRW